MFVYEYTFDDTPPPVTGEISTDVLPAADATHVYISYTPIGTGSYAPILRTIKTGDELLVTQKTNADEFARWVCSGAVVDDPVGGYVDVPVTFDAASATGEPVNGDNVFLFITMYS
jgi:hypothetical protein